ncbi:metalloendoproteinase 2-MMP [Heracleum sosnowskyi]|uniref:Metalloendoproteinase 2-MMP n=1 Tax=Heracleum sosnowskyi TaxID=360622 RepID=A0AAD8I977_9APIA|nr:metalloendoproteinase 2-MMP [Heracleum sosnowskyi]
MSLNFITSSLFLATLSSLIFGIHAFPDDFIPKFFPNISSLPPPTNLSAAWDSFRNLTGCRSGESREGLAKLKQYFQQFGYLDNQNYTNDFDQSLESALKTYQRNFNLNSTGELDQTTLDLIQRPRCGVADIVNGTSTMNSGKSKSSPFHVVAHYSYFPGSPRWPNGQNELTYSFATENQLDDTFKSVFRTAFDRWSAVTTLTFLQTDSYRSADIKIGFYSGDHGDGEPFDGVLGTLAHAFSPPSGRLHLDGSENWVINGDDLKSVSAVDLESVVVHEIGHLLGLGHSSVEEAVMYPSIPSGARKVQLAGDDVDGIQSLYGSNPTYVASTNPGSQEREASYGNVVGPVWGEMLGLVAALVLFIL